MGKVGSRRMRKACTSILDGVPDGTIGVAICIGPEPYADFQASTAGPPLPDTAEVVADRLRKLADAIAAGGLGFALEGAWDGSLKGES